jgi:hypothetical protein
MGLGCSKPFLFYGVSTRKNHWSNSLNLGLVVGVSIEGQNLTETKNIV